jgi:hypothetical protein
MKLWRVIMLIRDIFPVTPQTGDLSLEIELQGHGLPHISNDIWNTKTDGSLKDDAEGLEYLFREPLPFDQVETELYKFVLRFRDSDVLDSFYAGTHVHINVQDITLRQLLCYICTYIVLEDLLVEWCGPTRVGNHFCLRMNDADYLIDYIKNMISEDNVTDLSENLRYSSMNIMSIPLFGSLEFRSLSSSLDVERMMKWCKILMRMKKNSILYGTPDVLISSISCEGYDRFAASMLGEDLVGEFLTDGWLKKMRKGVVNAQDLAYAKNWRELNLNIFKKSVF